LPHPAGSRFTLDKAHCIHHTRVVRSFDFRRFVVPASAGVERYTDMTDTFFSCEQCGKSFAMRPELLGKRVKCAGCGTVFVVEGQQPDALGPDVAMDPAEMAQPGSSVPNVEDAQNTSFFHWDPERGPTDRQFRIGSLVAIAATILGTVLVMALEKIDIKGLIILALGPFVFFYGLAALVDPNIPRAVGKHGKHLSTRYKIIGGVIGLVALAVSGGMSVWLYSVHCN